MRRTQLEENDEGVAALAVPVRVASWRVVASLAVAAPLFRKDLEALAEFLPPTAKRPRSWEPNSSSTEMATPPQPKQWTHLHALLGCLPRPIPS